MNRYKTIGRPSELTQFRVEAHLDGLWTKKTGNPEPEIRICKEFDGSPTRYGPSVPLSAIPDLICELEECYKYLKQLQEDRR